METHSLPDDVVRDEVTNIVSVTTEIKDTNRGLGYEFFRCFREHKDKIAQYIADTGEIDTYGSFLQRIVRTAVHLRERNLTKDDVVCLCSYNSKNNCVPFLSCIFLGIPVASLATSYTVGESTQLIKLVKPKMFFIVPEVIDMITESIENAGVEAEIVVDGDDVDVSRFTAFHDFLEQHEEENEFEPMIMEDLNRTAVVFFSSGTTGLPKGICSSHKTIYNQGLLFRHVGLFGSDSVFLGYSTLQWVTAVSHLATCIISGSARLVCKNYEPEIVWHLIDKYKITYSFLAPIQAYNLISYDRPEGIDTTKLYALVTGGAPFALGKLQELRDLLPGTFVFQGYGSTEFAGMVTYFNLNKTTDKLLLHYKPTSCGRPLPGFQYKIVDIETGDTCGPNEKGELRVKSAFALTGYYHQDSSSAFDDEGWVRTGDIIYYDQDFCFYIVDRIKEMLKYKSWQIAPAMLEGILQTHPSVKQCVIIGIPDEIDGDHPMAVLKLHEEYEQNVSAEEIEEFIAERVNDTQKLRGGVKFVEHIPVTATGKFKRKEIRDMVLNGLL